MSTSTRLICAFVESQATGERFKRPDWPLHATVVPWFKLKASEAELNNALQESLNSFNSFIAQVIAQDNTRYIPNRGVSLLEPDPWEQLHESLFSVVAQYAGTFATRLFTGITYRPHITFQRDGALHLDSGDEFLCDSLYIIEKQGRYREVVKRLALVASMPNGK